MQCLVKTNNGLDYFFLFIKTALTFTESIDTLDFQLELWWRSVLFNRACNVTMYKEIFIWKKQFAMAVRFVHSTWKEYLWCKQPLPGIPWYRNLIIGIAVSPKQIWSVTYCNGPFYTTIIYTKNMYLFVW